MKDKTEVWKELRKYKNVVGYDPTLVPRIRNGKTVKTEKVIRVFVTRKIPKSCVTAKPTLKQKIIRKLTGEPFLPSDFIPEQIDGIPTDVIEIGEVKALYDDPKQVYRPVIAGVSACHEKLTACTISGFFRTSDGKVLVASNNHCFALENKARIGDRLLQPSPYDGGTSKDVIGKLHSFIELKFEEFKCPFRRFFHNTYRFVSRAEQLNVVDIAFGTLSTDFRTTCANIDNAFRGTAEAKIGMAVKKMGRTTGYTEGKVVSTDWTGSVSYSRGTTVFTDCILVEGRGFSRGGDSGSPVFDRDGNVIGVLFAGSDSHTIVCKIGNIMKLAGVELIKCEGKRDA